MWGASLLLPRFHSPLHWAESSSFNSAASIYRQKAWWQSRRLPCPFSSKTRTNNNAPRSGLWVLALAVAAGVVLGLVNGMLHVFLRIPSFITTLAVGFIASGI